MDSRERVMRAVKREGPDRAPRDLWELPATRPALGQPFADLAERWGVDFAKTGFAQWPDGERLFRVGQHTDHWGATWTVTMEGLLGMVTGYPLGDDDAFDGWAPPLDDIPKALTNLPKQIEEMSGDKFRLGGGLELFHRMCWLRPMEKIMMDMIMAPDRFNQLLGGVVKFCDALCEELLKLDLDALLIVDDWGTQRQTFISPTDWRQHFKPHYQRWAAEAHRAGKMMFMHSDGHILPIIPDLDEIGIDALNCEVDCMGREKVAEVRGKICQWGEVDRQNLLPRGKPEEVAEAARQFRETFDRPEGGVILQSEIGPDVPVRNVEALFTAWGM